LYSKLSDLFFYSQKSCFRVNGTTRFQFVLSGTVLVRVFNKRFLMEKSKMASNAENFFENYLERVKVHFGHNLIAYKKNSVQKNIAIINNAMMIQLMGIDICAYAYVGIGDLDNAIRVFDTAIEVAKKNNMPNNYKSCIYTNRGATYGEKGYFDKAITDFDEALRLSPDLADSYYNRSLAYLGKGNFDNAFTDCDKALKLKFILDYEQLDAYLIRGFLYGRKGDFDKAIADFETALQLRLGKVNDDKDIEAYFHSNAWEYREYARQAKAS